MIDLKDALVFTKVVEQHSFAKAGEVLGLPASAVSRRVSRLETALGARLLQRTTRSLTLTDVGKTYFDHAARAMDELACGEAAVGILQAEPRGTVRLTTAHGLAADVWQAAQGFLNRHPDVILELDVSERFADLVDGRIDLAIRAGVLPDSALVARKLASAHGQLFASPDYLANAPPLESIADLENHQCIITGGAVTGASWMLYAGRKPRAIRVTGRVAIANLHLAVQAATEGFGIVRAPTQIAEPLVAKGQLQRVLAPVHAGAGAIWLVYAARAQMSAAVRGLSEHLLASLPARLASPPEP